ncbi:DsrE/DsrF/DrsH-like family protein [Fusibacter ferrireducens]|uniref:FAD-dependent oxidoreductase n=1 Tax=Fusibacter ferrireducens TaxID=2785058 RepID=A0ABR9ZSR7_9FIRM|nr:DsrE/DsrF/DrsH-like family protein [Fusibacter ferrireducens]MBF4693183.1 FAD-dependent oxidoreductase [Fusibacter ferrireducens]
MKKILIVGGVAGGASTAARMRRMDESAEIIMFERGEYISFANCGLPYYIGGAIEERSALLVQTPEGMKERFNIDVRVQNEVLSIDREKKTISVNDIANNRKYDESYDVLVLSPGSTPLKPPIPGIDSPNIFTLWNIPDVDRIKSYVDHTKPQKAVVIGGGFIGLEMAENLHDRGMEVSVVEMADQVMAPVDFEMAQIVHRHMKQKKVNLYLGDGVQSFEYHNGLTKVKLQSGKIVEADIVMLSIGVRPQSELAKAAGLEINGRGGIVVSDTLVTSDPSIYAIGDAVEVVDFIGGQKTMIPLAGPANKQGRICADNIAGKNVSYKGTQGTSVAKVFDLTVSSTGVNEKSLKRDGKVYGKDYYTTIIHPNSHAGYYPGAIPMTLKLIFGMDGKVLGAQNVGYDGVEKRIDVIATAIRFGGTVYDLTELELAYAPPYSSAKDPVNMAGFVGENILKGITKPFQWHEFENIDSDVIILDVRTPLEREMGYIENSINIPVDDLRERMVELDKSKKIVVYCAVGIRGYAAQRILEQNGFDKVYNLMGGYTTYSVVFCQDDATKCGGTLLGEDIHVSEFGDVEDLDEIANPNAETIKLNACGLQCPGPIMQVHKSIESMTSGDILEVKATDPGFMNDIGVWCEKTGNTLMDSGKEDKAFFAKIRKGKKKAVAHVNTETAVRDDKTMVVFSGDLDKAIATMIIANGAASMGKKVTLFFTFWGLNILRKSEKVSVKKDFVSKMFSAMMPRGTTKLKLSKMHMMGMGSNMIRMVMKKHNVDSIEDMLKMAQENGVRMVACNMSMDLMGISAEELIDGVEFGGVASMLGAAEDSNMSLFI